MISCDIYEIRGVCQQLDNAHMFYIKVRDLCQRQNLIRHLREQGVDTVFHYVPLHSSPGGIKYGRFVGTDCYTTKESSRLLRLPMWYGMAPQDIDTVAEKISDAVVRKEWKEGVE